MSWLECDADLLLSCFVKIGECKNGNEIKKYTKRQEGVSSKG